jgi:amino acid permease
MAFILALMIMSLLIMARWRIEKRPASFMTWTNKLVVIAVTWGVFVGLAKTREVKHS